jgi:hypothetical protein
MSDLLALAERCEAASEGGSDLDNAILNALGYSWRGMGYWFHDDSHQWKGGKSFTTSIDAAMALLDQYGVLMQLSDIGADGLPLARVGRPDLDGESIFTGISSGVSIQATPLSGLALALCAAALRARAAASDQCTCLPFAGRAGDCAAHPDGQGES